VKLEMKRAKKRTEIEVGLTWLNLKSRGLGVSRPLSQLVCEMCCADLDQVSGGGSLVLILLCGDGHWQPNYEAFHVM
jgi:hypothetical protein